MSKIDNWIDEIITRSSSIDNVNPKEEVLIEFLVKESFRISNEKGMDVNILLSSCYDLVTSAEYYSMVAHAGWLYCPHEDPRIFFHYTNCCPRHVLTNEFHFNPSNKPTSGKIGTASAKLLLIFYKCIFKYLGRSEVILRGVEPVDAIILDQTSNKILFAEIKASPLCILPLSAKSDRITQESEGEIITSEHEETTISQLSNTEIDLMIPVQDGGIWKAQYFSLGKRGESNSLWAYEGLLNLIKSNEGFLLLYHNFWVEAMKSYYPKRNTEIFWLTNACGTPSPIPNGWKKRRVGAGFESISDSKTSVGMDRTDDIKKGIYQVLKLGAEGKPITTKWDFKVGIISNLHAARHFEEYLKALKDIVWTNDLSGNARYVRDLPSDSRVYNLFDGIIALSQSHTRDPWLEELFVFGEKK